MPTPAEIFDAAKRRAVFVRWIDSCGSGGWRAVEPMYQMHASTVDSVGYVLREDEEEIVIAQSLDPDNDSVDNCLTIPRVGIVDIWEIDQ